MGSSFSPGHYSLPANLSKIRHPGSETSGLAQLVRRVRKKRRGMSSQMSLHFAPILRQLTINERWHETFKDHRSANIRW